MKDYIYRAAQADKQQREQRERAELGPPDPEVLKMLRGLQLSLAAKLTPEERRRVNREPEPATEDLTPEQEAERELTRQRLRGPAARLLTHGRTAMARVRWTPHSAQTAAMRGVLLQRVWDNLPRLERAFPNVQWDLLSQADCERLVLDIIALLDGLDMLAGCERCPDPKNCKRGKPGAWGVGVPITVDTKQYPGGPLHFVVRMAPCPRRADLTRAWAEKEGITRGYRVRYPPT